MTTDALDPGPSSDYPFLPRNPDGSLDIVRMPVGTRTHRVPDGTKVLIDIEPTVEDGRRVSQIPPPGS